MPTDLSRFVEPDPSYTDGVRSACADLVAARQRLSEARRQPPGRRFRVLGGIAPHPSLIQLVSAYNDALDEHSRLASQVALLRNRIASHPDAHAVETYERRTDSEPLERAVEEATRARYLAVRAALDAGVTKNQLGRDVGHDVNWARRVLSRRPASLGPDPDAPADVSPDLTVEEF